LQDPAFLIDADLYIFNSNKHFIEKGRDGAEAAFRAMFEKNLQRGSYERTPFLGVREFEANVRPPQPTDRPFPFDWRGSMHTIRYTPEGRPDIAFFDAEVVGGVMQVPKDIQMKYLEAL